MSGHERPPAGEPEHRADAISVLVDDVSVQYTGRMALRGVSLRLAAGQRSAVVGPNGAGKSTLFKVIAGIIKPSSGAVHVYGSAPDRHVCIAYIEQQANINWAFPLTVADVVGMGRVARIGTFRFPGRRDRQIVTEALEQVAMTGLRDRQIGELSGGQQRRMFIARALAQEAEIMLLDEPFANLDAGARTQLHDTLDQLDRSITVMVATHDLDVAERMGHVLLLNGRPIAAGAPRAVLAAANLAQAYGKNLRRIGAGGASYVLPDTHCDAHGHGVSHGQGGSPARSDGTV